MRRAVFDDYLGRGITRWARRWLANGGLVIDVGANIGQTVCFFAGLPKTRVVAIDPNPVCIAWIQECLEWYTAWDVQLSNCGLSDEPGELELYVPDFQGEEGAQATLRADWYVNRAKQAIRVPVARLDDLLQSDDRVRLWKLDVEGWEHKVLEGARDALMSGRVEALFAEVHPTNRDYFRRTMQRAGMDIFDVTANGQLVRIGDTLPPLSDFLAIHRSAVQA
jgi:FkbM family methyltransferase